MKMRESTKLLVHAFGILAYPMVNLLIMVGIVINVGTHVGFLGAAYIAFLLLWGMHVGAVLHTAPKEAAQLMKDAEEAVRREDSDV